MGWATSSRSWPGTRPGAGGSKDPPESFRLPEYADCLAGFVAALGLERPHLCGLSFGGGLALSCTGGTRACRGRWS
jgi:pimeloyl-ACP methyl ester carboxylesterase